MAGPYWVLDPITGEYMPHPENNPEGIHGTKPPNEEPTGPEPTSWDKYGLEGGTGNDWFLAAILDQLEAGGADPESLMGYIDQWNALSPDRQAQAIDSGSNDLDAMFGGFNDEDEAAAAESQRNDDWYAMTREEFMEAHGYDAYRDMIAAGHEPDWKGGVPGSGDSGPTIPSGPPEEPGDAAEEHSNQWRDTYDGYGRDLEGFFQALDTYEQGQQGYHPGQRPPMPKINDYDFDFSQLRESEKERLTSLGYQPFWEADPDGGDGDGDGTNNTPPIIPPGDEDVYNMGNQSAQSFQSLGLPQSEGGKAYAAVSGGLNQGPVSSQAPIDQSLLGNKATGKGTMFTSSTGTGMSSAFGQARTRAKGTGRPQDDQKPMGPPQERNKATWGGRWS